MADRSNVTALPNLLTYGRIAAIPVIVVCALWGNPALRWVALALYILAAISDFFDGYLARKWNQSSPLGRMLDPIADKLLVGVLIVTFAFDHTIGHLGLVPGIVIIMREMLVSGLREYLGPRNVVVHVTRLAKWKTTSQLVALGVLFLVPLYGWAWIPGEILFWIAGLLTAVTGYEYYKGAWPHLVGEGE